MEYNFFAVRECIVSTLNEKNQERVELDLEDDRENF